MIRHYVVAALSLLGLLFAPLRSHAADDLDKPVLVHLQAALEIDRNGQVVAVEFLDDKKVPAAILQQAQKTALAWKFQPPTKAGLPVSGRTYAGIQACLVPSGDGIDFSLAYSGNGPASTFHRPRKPGSSSVPVAKLMGQGTTQLKGKVVYVVSPEGEAKVESATLDDPKLQAQYGHLWLKDQRQLFKYFRYRPELIDGVPTATRLETVVENRWFDPAELKAVHAEEQARDERSDACRALRNENGRQIASDSPFKRIEG
jgi:hypothetical protein